jgi:PleD family two-component response regulator
LISLDQLSNPVDIMKKINPPGTKILVVDDHPFNVMAIKLLLYKFPWIIVDSIYDGRSAIQLAVFIFMHL